MRKSTIFPAIMLSFVTLGTVATALPATAAPSHHATARAAGEDTDTPDTVPGGGGSTPSGGAATGLGGTAADGTTHSATPWLLAGGAGLALLGAGAYGARRATSED
jgi:hypothetical protein